MEATQSKIDLGTVGEILLANGEANVSASLDIPSQSMQENEKYPYTPWNVEQLQKQIDKDLRRLAQTVANFQYVQALVEARGEARSTVRANSTVAKLEQKLAAARAKLAAQQQSEVPQPEA